MRKLVMLLVMAFSSAALADRVEFANMPLEEVVKFVGPKFDHPIIIGADLSNKKISLYGSYETPQQLEFLLQRSVESVGLNYVIAADVATISSVKMPDVDVDFERPALLQGDADSAPFVVMPPEQMPEVEEPVINHVYPLRYVQSAYVVDAVMPAFAQEKGAGRPILVSLPTSNSLVFAGTQAQFDLMNTLLPEVDKPRQQVLITAVVAELSDSNFRSLGANLKGAFGDLSLASVTMSSRSDLGTELTFSGPKLSAFVQAVENSGDSQVLSTPQLLVMNREKASIVVGQNVPFLTGSTTSAATPAENPYQTITRQDVGLTLDVQPTITPTGDVELVIKQTASSVSNDRTASDIITNTRRLNTKITLHDGAGVLLGGLRQQTTDESTSGVPGLRSIPWLGRLFEFKSTSKKTTNLVVLISARVFQDSTPTTANGEDSASRLERALGKS